MVSLGAISRVAALGAALALAVPGTVAADELVSHSGLLGAHSLTDSWEYPGVRCSYDEHQNAARIRVRPPTVFARDRSSGRDSQWVGWRIELQYHPDEGGSWSTVQKSSVVTAKAWDDQAASFRQRTVTVAHPRGSGRWRVVARMLWYRPGTDSDRQGMARHRFTFYDYPLTEPGAASFCPAGIL
jgi:hypothetical protein